MPSVHQEVRFPATPARVYRALMDGAEHSAFTGDAAEIDGSSGGAFSAYGGRVHGRNLELVAGRLIVQAWRAGDWPAGTWSIARFELLEDGAGTRLVFDHTGIPSGTEAHLRDGWTQRYWEPLRRHLEA